jgi:ribosomal protein S12 methylthiotransferase accessory factor
MRQSSDSSPEAAISRVLAHKDAFGITRVANLTGLDRTGIPVVMVCRPNSRSSAVFNGKGLDVNAAKAAGLMEAVETWHAENVQLPLRFTSLADLSGRASVVDVDGLARRPGSVFDDQAPMLWVEGRDLFDETPTLTPFEVVHADSRMCGPPMSGALAMSTNGLASGAQLSDAIRHALCELIERDATSLWPWRSPAEQNVRRLDLATVDDASVRTAIGRLTAACLDIGVWDIATDVGVPTFYCLVADRTEEIGHIGVGAACHPRRGAALLRAVVEAAQVRTTYIIGSREDIEPGDYAPATILQRNREARRLLASPMQTRSFASLVDVALASAEAEVNWLLGRLRAIGVRQAIAVDLTQSAYGIPVVRVVVPGLEGSDHHRAQYLPGPRARAIQGRAS